MSDQILRGKLEREGIVEEEEEEEAAAEVSVDDDEALVGDID